MKEEVILSHLTSNEHYARKVMPFLKTEYFSSRSNAVVFDIINDYSTRYNLFPPKEVILTTLDESLGLTQEEHNTAVEVVKNFQPDAATSVDWLLDETEHFCKFKSLTNAIIESLKIIEARDKRETRTPEIIPELLTDALAVSFNPAVGHDYFDDAEERYDLKHKQEYRLPFDLKMLNRITKGGLFKKTLTIVMASTGVGKSAFMCHCAAHHLMIGKNVLYITLEMPREEISTRIDMNLLGLTQDEIDRMRKDEFLRRVQGVRQKSKGRLVVEEFPPASVGAAHFRHLLRELRIKKNFVPDIIYVDYLNECVSTTMKMSEAGNSYAYIKAIAKELRALGVEFDCPIFTATQSNRSGYEASDVGLDSVAESFGLTNVADLMFALILTDELREKNEILAKQLKNRYNALDRPRKFILRTDPDRMRYMDAPDQSQSGLHGGGPLNPAPINTLPGVSPGRRDFGDLKFTSP